MLQRLRAHAENLGDTPAPLRLPRDEQGRAIRIQDACCMNSHPHMALAVTRSLLGKPPARHSAGG